MVFLPLGRKLAWEIADLDRSGSPFRQTRNLRAGGHSRIGG
jgi:hypothetical protein